MILHGRIFVWKSTVKQFFFLKFSRFFFEIFQLLQNVVRYGSRLWTKAALRARYHPAIEKTLDSSPYFALQLI